MVEGAIQLVQPQSDEEEEEDLSLTRVDDDLSTSHMARDAAASVGVTRTGAARQTGDSVVTQGEPRKRPAPQRNVGQTAKRQSPGTLTYLYCCAVDKLF